jgi:hypothetical protein
VWLLGTGATVGGQGGRAAKASIRLYFVKRLLQELGEEGNVGNRRWWSFVWLGTGAIVGRGQGGRAAKASIRLYFMKHLLQELA